MHAEKVSKLDFFLHYIPCLTLSQSIEETFKKYFDILKHAGIFDQSPPLAV